MNVRLFSSGLCSVVFVVMCVGSSAHASLSPVHFVDAWQACVGSRLTRGIVQRKSRNVYFSEDLLSRESGIAPEGLVEVAAGRRAVSLSEARLLSKTMAVHGDWLMCVDLIRATFGEDPDGLVNEFATMPYAFETVARAALRLPPATPRPERPVFADEPPPLKYKLRFVPRLTPVEFEHAWRQRVARRLGELFLSRWDDRDARITNKDIERTIGMHSTRMTEVRQGRKALSVEQGFAIAQMFGVDGKWLLDFGGIRRQFSDPAALRGLSRMKHPHFHEVAEFALGLSSIEAIRSKPKFGSRMKGCSGALTYGPIGAVKLPRVRKAKLVSQD